MNKIVQVHQYDETKALVRFERAPNNRDLETLMRAYGETINFEARIALQTPYSLAALAAAFTEWERRYREEPSRFLSEVEKRGLKLGTYGEACASFLATVLDELYGIEVPK